MFDLYLRSFKNIFIQLRKTAFGDHGWFVMMVMHASTDVQSIFQYGVKFNFLAHLTLRYRLRI